MEMERIWWAFNAVSAVRHARSNVPTGVPISAAPNSAQSRAISTHVCGPAQNYCHVQLLVRNRQTVGFYFYLIKMLYK
jgi:hypothetical protein